MGTQGARAQGPWDGQWGGNFEALFFFLPLSSTFSLWVCWSSQSFLRVLRISHEQRPHPGVSLGWSCREPWWKALWRVSQVQTAGYLPWGRELWLWVLRIQKRKSLHQWSEPGFPPEGVKGMLSMESPPPCPPAPYTASQGGWSFPGKASFLSLVFCYCCHCLICSTVHLQCRVSFRCAASTVIQLCIHISILSQSLLPYGLIQSIEQSSWCSAVGPTAYLFCISSHAHLVLCWESITWYGDAIPLEKSCMFPYEIVQKTVWCKGKQGDQDGRGSEK